MFGPLGTEKYDEYCRDIRESGKYLLDVINDILDMSKIEAGRMRLDREALELDRLLGEAMRVISGRAQEKSIKLDSRVQPGVRLVGGPPRGQADRAQPPVQRREVHARGRPHPPARPRQQRRRCSSRIADDGIGIPKDALQRLGRPFEQVESQLTKSHQGSGLGLAISKSLAELHGGRLRIRSRPGVGTMVVVRLPARPLRPSVVSRTGRPERVYGVSPRMRTKLCAHLRLRLDDMRLERGEVRHVGGAHQQAAAARRRPSCGSNGPGRHSRRICVRS